MPLSRWWLVLALPAVGVAGAGLALTVQRLVRTVRASVVASVPLSPTSRVAFDEPGEFALSIETANGLGRVHRFKGLSFTLVGSRGERIEAWRALSRTQVSSLTRERFELARVRVPAPGTYTLYVVGGEVAEPNDRAAIVVSHPIGGRIALSVIALLLLGMVFIGATVVAILAATGRALESTS